MPTLEKPTDSLGIGLYTLTEAARLLKTPRKTLSRWMEGYVEQLRDGAKAYPPVIDSDDGPSLTFGDLVELLYVRGFRDRRVPLDEIRDVTCKYREKWKNPYPLATKRFATDGVNLLLKEEGAWRHSLSGQQIAFSDLAEQLVHIGDLVTEWRPLGKDRAVVLDPQRAFGKPIEETSGAHTYVLSQALAAGDSAKDVAWWYGTTEQAVLDAREFEESLMGGRTS